MIVMTVMTFITVMAVKIAVTLTVAMTAMMDKYTQTVMAGCNDWNALIFTYACASTDECVDINKHMHTNSPRTYRRLSMLVSIADV